MPCCAETYEKLPAAPSPRFARANAASAIASVEANVRLNSVSDDDDDDDDDDAAADDADDADNDADDASDTGAEAALGYRQLAKAKRARAAASGTARVRGDISRGMSSSNHFG